jgi:hypothetical protein
MSTPFFGANTSPGERRAKKSKWLRSHGLGITGKGCFQFSTTMFTISQALVSAGKGEETLQSLRPVYIVFRDEPFDGH